MNGWKPTQAFQKLPKYFPRLPAGVFLVQPAVLILKIMPLLPDFFTPTADYTPYTLELHDSRVFDAEKAMKKYDRTIDWRKIEQGPPLDNEEVERDVIYRNKYDNDAVQRKALYKN